MLEGVAHDGIIHPVGPAQRVGLQTLRASPVAAAGLDILVEMDEPEELMIALAKLGQQRQADKRWDVVWAHASQAVSEFEVLNRPRR